MRLVPHDTVPTENVQHEFRNQSWRGLALATLVMVGIAAYTAIPKQGASDPAVVGATVVIALFFSLLLLLRWNLCRRPQNWLLRKTDHGVYINLRSFVNYHLSKESHQALYVPNEDIAAVCKANEERELPYRHGYTKDRYSYIDLYLKRGVDLEPVRRAVREERRREAAAGVLKKRKQHDYPVRVLDPPGIRLVWDWIKPDEGRAIDVLAESYDAAPDLIVESKLWGNMSDDEKEALIEELWEIGHVDDAVRLVRMRNPMNDRAARRWLQEQYGDDGP
jgi:hypothetical protein